VALLDRSTRTASLVAADDSHFIRIPAQAIEALRRNAVFEQKLVARVAAIVRGANDHVRAISAYSSVARVAWCLVRIARQEGRVDGQTVVIAKRPHHELAEMTGCQRETVSRALSTLKRKKQVTWDDDVMRLDLEALQRYVAA
jgi:CRP-like cAMP-binding protein